MIRAGAIALLLLLVPCAAAAAGKAAVFELIAARLALMKPVAEWKHRHVAPVEDIAREAVVLDRAVADAAAAGLAQESVRPFFQAQITAAKAIQRCWIGRWHADMSMPANDPPDLKTEIRPQLIDLGARLIAALRDSLAEEGRFDGRTTAAFASTVETDCLDREARGPIYIALTRIRLAERDGK